METRWEKEIKRRKKLLITVGSIILVLSLIVGGTIIYKRHTAEVLKNNLKDIKWVSENVLLDKDLLLGNDIYAVTILNDNIDIFNMKYQEAVNNKIEELKKENNDIVVYNPYGTNTLGLNLYLNKSYKEVSYDIDVDSPVISNFSKKLKHNDNNSYQLIGLVGGYKNNVSVRLVDNNDNIEYRTFTIDLTDVETLSPTTITKTNGESNNALDNGLYTLLGNDSDDKDYVAMYDNNGVLREEIPIIGYRAHKILFNNDRMYFSISQTKIAEIDNLGRITKILRTGKYQLHHDYVFDDNNNLLVLANDTTKDTEEDCIIKINVDTNKTELVIDFEDKFKKYVDSCTLDTTSARDEGEDGLDWLHLNSIVYLNGDIIVSSRETSSIIRVNDIYGSKIIKYIISNKKFWKGTDFSDLVYDQEGDFLIHGGQHSLNYVEGEDGLYKIRFYNNNYGKSTSKPNFKWNKVGVTNDNPFAGDKSFYYEYEIDEDNHLFRLTDSVEVPYSGIVSSVQDLNNGNLLTDSGVQGIFIEFDNEHKKIAEFKVEMNKYMVYRVLKYDFNNFYFE